MNQKNKYVSSAHIELPEKNGKIPIFLNFHPTVTALETFGKSLVENKDKFWKKMGAMYVKDSYLLHYLLREDILPKSVNLDIKAYKAWIIDQKKIRRRQ